MEVNPNNRLYISIIFYFLTIQFSISQNKFDSILNIIEINKYENFKKLNFQKKVNKLQLSDDNSLNFESQGIYHSTYLILYKNNEYLYYSIFEVGFDISFGEWKFIEPNKVKLFWNKEKTLGNLKNKDLINKIYNFSFPRPIKMDNWEFIIPKN